jgi:hypothetical protein
VAVEISGFKKKSSGGKENQLGKFEKCPLSYFKAYLFTVWRNLLFG